MQVGREVLEWAAEGLLRASGLDLAPQDAFALAHCCGLDVQPWGEPGGALEGDVLYYPAGTWNTRQQRIVCHELGHWTLDWAELPQSETGADYVGDALMLPRAPFERDLADTWDLLELQARHYNASSEVIARRIASVREAVVTVVDDGHVTARVCGDKRLPGLPTPPERELAAAALLSGAPQKRNDLFAAYPVFDGGHRRVVVIAEVQQVLRLMVSREYAGVPSVYTSRVSRRLGL